MKIIQIGSFPNDVSCIKGGVEASVYGLAMEQAKNNNLIVIDVPRVEVRVDNVETISAIKVFRFSTKGKNNYSALFRLKAILRIIRSFKPDICHIHSTSLFSFVTYLLLRFNKIPVLVTVHGLAHIEKLNVWRGKKSIKNLIKYLSQSLTEFLFLMVCPVFIVDTHYVLKAIQLYKKQGKIFRLPTLKVIPQGINSVFFDLRNQPAKLQLISVGALSKRKGYLYLIDSLVKVKNIFPDFNLSIMGTISEPAYFKIIQTRIVEYGLENNVELLPNLKFDEVLRLYQQADIFVLHSEEESQGIVFCEAMAAGKPIVATSIGGIPWVVENGINGILSDYGDINTFANNIINLLEDDELKKRISERNRLDAQKYNWEIIEDEIMKLYKIVIDDKW